MTYIILLLTFLACQEDEQPWPVSKPPTTKPVELPLVELFDSLNQTSKGEIIGDIEFIDGGGMRSLGGKIVYDFGEVLSKGTFEAKMKGWTAPAQGTDKYHPLSGWEHKDQYTHYLQTGSFWNWRIGMGYEPFKVLAAPKGIDTREEKRVGRMDQVNASGAEEWHTYKVSWNKGSVNFYIDDYLLGTFTFSQFNMRYFVIGKDSQYDLSSPAPVISMVKISNQ